MAKLSSFKIDSNAIKAGEWVRPGTAFGDLEILTRGVTDEYLDARKAKVRAAAALVGGDEQAIGNATWRRINTECVTELLALDVRNLSDDNGVPVPFADFVKVLADPDYQSMVNGALQASAKVGMTASKAAADAVPN